MKFAHLGQKHFMSNFAYTSTCCIAWERMRQNAFGPVPHTHWTLYMQIVPLANGDEQFLQMTLVAGAFLQCVIFGCQLFRASLGGSCCIGHCSSFHGRGNWVSVCVWCVRRLMLAPLQDNRAGWSLPHLSPESPTPDVEWEAQQVMGSSL